MIDKKNTADLVDLQNTLRSNKHITEVHFTATGEHYLNKYPLDGKEYGMLKNEQVFAKIVGERKFFKLQSVATPESLIVQTLSRGEILAIQTSAAPEKISAKDKKALEAALSENEALKAKLAELEGK